jgi:DNA polymerase sigma
MHSSLLNVHDSQYKGFTNNSSLWQAANPAPSHSNPFNASNFNADSVKLADKLNASALNNASQLLLTNSSMWSSLCGSLAYNSLGPSASDDTVLHEATDAEQDNDVDTDLLLDSVLNEDLDANYTDILHQYNQLDSTEKLLQRNHSLAQLSNDFNEKFGISSSSSTSSSIISNTILSSINNNLSRATTVTSEDWKLDAAPFKLSARAQSYSPVAPAASTAPAAASPTPAIDVSSARITESSGVPCVGRGIRRVAEELMTSLAAEPQFSSVVAQNSNNDDSFYTRTLSTLSRDQISHFSTQQQQFYEAVVAAQRQQAQFALKMQGLHNEAQENTVKLQQTAQLQAASNNLQHSQLILQQKNTENVAFQLLHEEILQFSTQCDALQSAQFFLREELATRTRWAIRCIWPTACVDLVGSAAARVALPKSDLDFVIYFPPCKDTEVRPEFTFSAELGAEPTVIARAAAQFLALNQQAALASQAAQQITKFDAAAAEIHSQMASKTLSTLYSGSNPTNSGLILQHFAHAGSLIKLIGGRKKSKLLFRSTKIQVFKDINLIRLRDGCSGVSMDLWFPINSVISERSQRHTQLILTAAKQFSAFYPLSCVIKTFMQQNLLNSGYSGLGSYGVLLMIIRFLQFNQNKRKPTTESRENSASEPNQENLGHLLCDFFRFYCNFDYSNYAISIKHSQFDKPDLSVLGMKKNKTPSQMGGGNQNNGNNSDDEEENEFPAQRMEINKAEEENSAELNNSSYTLVISDPEDETNYIICHHKALRNMIYAFIKAIAILDPTNPSPPVPVALLSSASINSGANCGSIDSNSTSNNNPANSSPLSLLGSNNSTNSSRFLRLIDIVSAHSGPAQKRCEECSSNCPHQNKVCFACGYMFQKNNQANANPAPSNGKNNRIRNKQTAANQSINSNTSNSGVINNSLSQLPSFSGFPTNNPILPTNNVNSLNYRSRSNNVNASRANMLHSLGANLQVNGVVNQINGSDIITLNDNGNIVTITMPTGNNNTNNTNNSNISNNRGNNQRNNRRMNNNQNHRSVGNNPANSVSLQVQQLLQNQVNFNTKNNFSQSQLVVNNNTALPQAAVNLNSRGQAALSRSTSAPIYNNPADANNNLIRNHRNFNSNFQRNKQLVTHHTGIHSNNLNNHFLQQQSQQSIQPQQLLTALNAGNVSLLHPQLLSLPQFSNSSSNGFPSHFSQEFEQHFSNNNNNRM